MADENMDNPDGGVYLSLKHNTRQLLIKLHYDGTVALDRKEGAGNWQQLLVIDPSTGNASFSGLVFEKGVSLSSKYISASASKIGEIVNTSHTKTNYSDAYTINHFTTLAICLETNSTVSDTWQEYQLGTITPAPIHVVRTNVSDQQTGISYPLKIKPDGKIYLETKGINAAGKWLYGGISYYSN